MQLLDTSLQHSDTTLLIRKDSYKSPVLPLTVCGRIIYFLSVAMHAKVRFATVTTTDQCWSTLILPLPNKLVNLMTHMPCEVIQRVNTFSFFSQYCIHTALHMIDRFFVSSFQENVSPLSVLKLYINTKGTWIHYTQHIPLNTHTYL